MPAIVVVHDHDARIIPVLIRGTGADALTIRIESLSAMFSDSQWSGLARRNIDMACTHRALVQPFASDPVDYCEDCKKIDGTWVNLWMCMVCG